MTAVVDIGNARIKWALASADRLLDIGGALHVDDPSSAVGSFVGAFPGGVDRVLATNVAGPSLAGLVEEAALGSWGSRVEWVSATRELLGVTCAYTEPSRMGADRWVAVLAAHSIARRPVCVIDAGTAVTFDAVDASGRHLGGLIMTGPRLAALSLSQSTSDIGPTDTMSEATIGLGILGRSTGEAVARGTMLALSSALNRAVAVVTKELEISPLVLLCGGDAETLTPWLSMDVELRKDLVLEGLALVAASSR